MLYYDLATIVAHTYADRQDTKKSKKIVSPSVPHRDSISDSDGLDLSVALERSQRQPLMHTLIKLYELGCVRLVWIKNNYSSTSSYSRLSKVCMVSILASSMRGTTRVALWILLASSTS